MIKCKGWFKETMIGLRVSKVVLMVKFGVVVNVLLSNFVYVCLYCCKEKYPGEWELWGWNCCFEIQLQEKVWDSKALFYLCNTFKKIVKNIICFKYVGDKNL